MLGFRHPRSRLALEKAGWKAGWQLWKEGGRGCGNGATYLFCFLKVKVMQHKNEREHFPFLRIWEMVLQTYR